MNRSVPVGELRELGDRACLIGVEDAAAGRSLVRGLRAALEIGEGVGACEVVGGLATVMVVIDSPKWDLDRLRPIVDDVRQGMASAGDGEGDESGQLVTVPCMFDGPDLREVAEISGCSMEQVIRLLTAEPLTVGVVGFSPGFAYLEGVPARLRQVPRRSTPRPAVPSGSVGLANGMAAVYPSASPGGWHLIGRTGASMFSPWNAPFSRLAPGDRVRFSVATAEDVVEPASPDHPGWSPPGWARTVFEVVQPGLRTTLQDGGRRGVAAIGVPAAGPADPVSFALANRLVGNPDGAGVLEVTARGPTLRCLEQCHVAVVGGGPAVSVQGQPVPTGQVFPVAVGQVVDVGSFGQGFRTYVAVAGGFVGPEVFGSVSSDELCGLGPGGLSAGQLLHAGGWAPPLGDHIAVDATGSPAGAPIVLRVVPGPHAEWFIPDVMQVLAEAAFVVEDESNRVGLRLRAATGGLRVGVTDVALTELDSQGVVTGAIQVPPDGIPVVLLPDHATLGGYPVAAVVAWADHGLLGQCAPGATVRLVPINQEEAGHERLLRMREMEGAVAGHYPLAVD